MNGISLLVKETPESYLVPFFTMRGYSKKTDAYDLGSQFSLDTKSRSLEVPELRNKWLLFKPPTLWHFCYRSSN